MLEEEHLAQAVCECLKIDCPGPDLTAWRQMVEDFHNPERTVTIGLVGKYVSLHDAYLSVAEALKHGGIANKAEVNIKWIDSEDLTPANLDDYLAGLNGILVPGGFGSRGIDGKILAVNYARTHAIPFLGICLGMQLAIIEFARNVLGYEDAGSVEFDPDTDHPVIHLMPDQEGVTDLGGTLRLGAYPCVIEEGCKTYELYRKQNDETCDLGFSYANHLAGDREAGPGAESGAEVPFTDKNETSTNKKSITIFERHRHRYEVNNDYREDLTAHGMTLSGISPDGRIVEMIELKDHPYFVATQAHPEFKSRPDVPHPLFRGFIEAALK